jgi:hypothetical protein
MQATELDHRKEFSEQGFTTARGFFNQEEMDSLIHDIRTADPKSQQPSGLDKGELIFYHNIFFRSKKLQQFISQPRLVDFLKQVIGPDFWVRWDQAVFKGPGSGEFPWHQDNGYNGLKNEHFQLWVALSKMNNERGGLWLVPGSHKNGILPHKSVGGHKAYVGSTENAICLDAEVGDVVLFSSLMLHYTAPNISNHDRWAYVVEYISLDHYDPYIKPPFFVVARDGKPQPEFVNSYRGRERLANRMKYVVPGLKQRAGEISSLVGRGVRTIRGKKR